MDTKISQSKGAFELVVIKDGQKDRQVLAAMHLYEGTKCWDLNDIRLSRFISPSPYSGSSSADHYCANITPSTPEEADYVKSVLREYKELENGEIIWCSYEGIVKGQTEVDGYAPRSWADFHPSGYFSKEDGLAYMKEAQKFWETVSEEDFKKQTWRMPHELHQPTMSDVMHHLTFMKMGRLEQFGTLPIINPVKSLKLSR